MPTRDLTKRPLRADNRFDDAFNADLTKEVPSPVPLSVWANDVPIELRAATAGFWSGNSKPYFFPLTLRDHVQVTHYIAGVDKLGGATQVEIAFAMYRMVYRRGAAQGPVLQLIPKSVSQRFNVKGAGPGGVPLAVQDPLELSPGFYMLALNLKKNSDALNLKMYMASFGPSGGSSANGQASVQALSALAFVDSFPATLDLLTGTATTTLIYIAGIMSRRGARLLRAF